MVNFLSIAFLSALPLVAAPILLHLFDRRRSVVVEWGAMQFLMEAATHKTRARRVQHWLLLLLRMAAIAALVLALARPLLPTGWLGAEGRRETIIVLDNSLSTLRKIDGQAAFARLVARADETLADLSPGDSVRILTTAPYPAWATPARVKINDVSRSALQERLAAMRPTQAGGDVMASLLKSVQSDFDDRTLGERRIVLLTDGQRADWRTDDASGWSRFRELLAKSPVPIHLDVVETDAAVGQHDNIAVTRVRANRAVIGVHQSFSVTAEIQNYAAAPSAACPVVWSIDDEAQHQSQAPRLEPGETRDLVWKHAFERVGVYTLTCRIDADDDLPADNTASYVLEVVERVPVLLVEGAEGFGETQQDTYLLRAALGRVEGDAAPEWRAVFEPRLVSPQQLETIDLAPFRAVVVPNLTVLSREAVGRLRQFVTAGGGLWLALGPRTEIPDFNRLLFNEGDGLSPVALDEAVDEAVDEPHDESRNTTINPFQKRHPATLELADNQRLDTGNVRVTRHYRFRKPAYARHVAVLLDLTNGDPLVVENRVGRGRVIVQGIPLRFQWSDLATSQAFVVMASAWLSYLSEPKATRHNLLPGEPISLQVAADAGTEATLTLPTGDDVAVSGEPVADGVMFRTSHTMTPGAYSLEYALSGDGVPFHVARQGAESNLAGLTDADREFLRNTAGLGQEGRAAPVAAAGRAAPMWPALLVLLIAVMAGELVLSGTIARKRFRAAPIPQTAEHSAGELDSPLTVEADRKEDAHDHQLRRATA